MNFSCLSICRQGWLGVPLFFIGVVSLAFSQLVQDEKSQSLSPEDQIDLISRKIVTLKDRLNQISKDQSGSQFDLTKRSATGNLRQLLSTGDKSDEEILSIQRRLLNTNEQWESRSKEIKQVSLTVEERINESEIIFQDLKDNFASRLDEAVPALNALEENLKRTETEMDAVAILSQKALSDSIESYLSLQSESNNLLSKALPLVPAAQPKNNLNSLRTNSSSPIVSKVSSSTTGAPMNLSSRFSPTVDTSAGFVRAKTDQISGDEPSDVISRLKSELAVSKSVQTELSVDTADMQSDLRKAYREIVSLRSRLGESEQLSDELVKSRDSLWQTVDGNLPTAKSVSVKIVRLENELQTAKEDLQNSKKALLIEQERSTAMIRSITSELDRTRKELDAAKSATINSVADSVRLASLERELNDARRALQMIKTAPTDPTQESYLAMQDELRKALGEITKMQIELSDKKELEKQIARLKSSMELINQGGGRAQNPEYANKLLIELNDAKREVKNAKSMSRQEGKELIERVAFLEQELKASQLSLKKTEQVLENTKEKMAKEEFEFASTIQRLEEDAQLTESSLSNLSAGQLPTIPFVEEMEKNLAGSEERIKLMSEQFESEQTKASELINGLKVELESAVLRQKRALDQLARKEAEMEGKDVELKATKEEAKKFKEELEVVKVIAGQLEDLNTVLDQTKETQNSQSSSLQQVVDSLKEELNQAKVELVFALEETEQYKNDSARMIGSLESQLEDTRNKLLAEQENQSDYTNETKDLILDLKSELVVAREEIARMKSAGLGESVQTNQAVAQLQEALGTIRILQESLEDAEKVNLEVDNLRSQLANSMESQLLDLQQSDDQKLALRKKTEDLEAEIALLREQGIGSGVEFKKANADLIEKLEISKAQIAELEKRSAMAEDNGVLSIIDLEEELALEKLKNNDLQSELAQKSLVPNQIAMVSDLEKQLIDAQNRLLEFQENQASERREGQSVDSSLAEVALEEKLQRAEETIANLEFSLDSQESKRLELQEQLSNTISRLENVEINNTPSSQEIEKLRTLLAEKDNKLNQLEEELGDVIVDMTEKEAQVEAAIFLKEEVDLLAQKLESAEAKIANAGIDSLGNSETKLLQDEINFLKAKLENAKGSNVSNNDPSILKLQTQLQDAVSYSFEVQTELEETKARLSELENERGNLENPELEKLLTDAKINEENAQTRIADLTNALRNSENLRKEMESLLSETEMPGQQVSGDLANDPKFLELQQELVDLQQDLVAAREMESPEVQDLRMELESSQNDSLRLNEEFKDAMENFSKIKDQVSLLEEENSRLQNITLSDAKNQSRDAISSLNSELKDLVSDNKNLKTLIEDRDNRIASLTEQLALSQLDVPGLEPDNAALRAQIVRLEGSLESAKNSESRAKQNAQNSMLESQDLIQKITLLEERLRDAMSNARGLPAAIPSEVTFNSETLNQEIEQLKDQNELLMEKLRSPSSIPERDQLDRRIRDLNQKNLMAQIQLDQERSRVEDLRKQLSESRDIKQEIVERGQSANLKVGLLNDELDDAKKRVFSLEQALIAAREAIRVLKSTDGSSNIQVSIPSPNRYTQYNPLSSNTSNRYVSSTRPRYSRPVPSSAPSLPVPNARKVQLGSPILNSSSIQQLPAGDSSIQLSAQVQFLNNKNRPAGFSEFFLVKNDLTSILSDSGIKVPPNKNIKSIAELWARSVQRGYRYPGVASSIRNALATNSLARLKTNSIGQANLDDIEPGRYFVIGTSPLGQVGVVWSKSVNLIPGSNNIVLDLRDAEWAQ
jgi:chromosome segregation ATPase